MSNNKEMKIIAGLDIGNGYVKGKATVDGGEPVSYTHLTLPTN